MFASGVINCNGKAVSFEEGRQRLQKYARKLQNLGCSVRLRDTKILTVSASHTLSTGLDLNSPRPNRSLCQNCFQPLILKWVGSIFAVFIPVK